MSLKIVFAGTPDFAIPSLQALMASHEVCAVYTKTDSPSGRGLKLTYSPIKQFVLDHYPNLPILQPVNLKDADTQRQLGEYFADVMVVIAYGLILPPPLLTLFKYGCINVHASLLPLWRGAAPIQRALLEGDRDTGITIMQIDQGLDTGDMLYQQKYLIKPDDTAGTVHNALANMGATALIEALTMVATGAAQPIVQDNHLATYATKISKEEARINWRESVHYVDRQIRAFNPWPIAYTHLGNNLLKIWQGEIVSTADSQHPAGLIVAVNDKGIDVATLQGVYRIKTIQIPGGKPMPVNSFLNARKELIIPNQTYLGEMC